MTRICWFWLLNFLTIKYEQRPLVFHLAATVQNHHCVSLNGWSRTMREHEDREEIQQISITYNPRLTRWIIDVSVFLKWVRRDQNVIDSEWDVATWFEKVRNVINSLLWKVINKTSIKRKFGDSSNSTKLVLDITNLFFSNLREIWQQVFSIFNACHAQWCVELTRASHFM